MPAFKVDEAVLLSGRYEDETVLFWAYVATGSFIKLF
jgi:hypothetical protein